MTRNELAEALKAARGDFPQSAVAAQADVVAAVINKAERGALPEDETLKKIARAIAILKTKETQDVDPEKLKRVEKRTYEFLAKAAARTRKRKNEMRLLFPPDFKSTPLFALASTFISTLPLKVACFSASEQSTCRCTADSTDYEMPDYDLFKFEPVWQSRTQRPYQMDVHLPYTDQVLTAMFRAGAADWIAVEDGSEIQSLDSAICLGRITSLHGSLKIMAARLESRRHITQSWREPLVELLEEIQRNCELINTIGSKQSEAIWEEIARCLKKTPGEPQTRCSFQFTLYPGAMRLFL